MRLRPETHTEFNLISVSNGCSSFKIINLRGLRSCMCVYSVSEKTRNGSSCPMFVCSCLLGLCNWFPQSASELVAVFFQKKPHWLAEMQNIAYICFSQLGPPPPTPPPPQLCGTLGNLTFLQGRAGQALYLGTKSWENGPLLQGGSPEGSAAP